MQQLQSHFYLSLFSNVTMAAALGIVFPYTIITTARTLRYMQNPSAKTWVRMALWWLGITAMSYAFGFVNKVLGPWSSDIFSVLLEAAAAVFTMSFGICCWMQRKALQSLYPQEEFILEQEKRQRLLDKLQACDTTMPLSRIESKLGVIVYANQAAQIMLGYSLQEFHQMQPGIMLHPDDRDRVLAIVHANSHETYECRILNRAGRIINVEIHSTHNPADPAVRISFLTDVTKYVEERDKRIRQLKLDQGLVNRRAAEDNLFSELSTQQPADVAA